MAKFESPISEIFRDVHTVQFHFIKLQTVRQKKNETTQEFGDRCRSSAQKTVTKIKDPTL
jgi:hypothetical protein